MKRIHMLGTALLAAACLAAAPALGAGKKSDSDSKSAESSKRRSEKKAKSKASKQKAPESKSALQVKRDSSPKPTSRVEPKRESSPKPKVKSDPKPSSKDAGRRSAEAAKERSSRTIREAPDPQRELNRQGNLDDSSSGNPADASGKAAELRAGRKTPGTESASAPGTSLRDGVGSSAPKETRPPIETGAPGTVANPVADPLAKAGGVASPAPTAEQLQAQSRAAKGDRTSQVSTVWRVDEKKPFGEQSGGIVVRDGDGVKLVDPDPEGAESNASSDEAAEQTRIDHRDAEAEQQAENDAQNERREEEAEKERAEREAQEQAAQDEADAAAEEEEKERVVEGDSPPPDDDDTDSRPNDVNATDYVTRMTDAEIAARNAETKAGLVNPTGTDGGRAVVDPNRAREIGRSASPRAGWAIDPGTGEAAGAAPTTGGVPERPDECDLAGGAAGDCGAGDGLR